MHLNFLFVYSLLATIPLASTAPQAVPPGAAELPARPTVPLTDRPAYKAAHTHRVVSKSSSVPATVVTHHPPVTTGFVDLGSTNSSSNATLRANLDSTSSWNTSSGARWNTASGARFVASGASLNASSNVTLKHIATDRGGVVDGCTSVATNVEYSQTEVDCIGTEVIISTVAAMASAFASQRSKASAAKITSAPNTGCAIGTHWDDTGDQYCTCAGVGTMSASSVSTLIGYSRGTVTTACSALPTGYVHVPPIRGPSLANWGLWATPSSHSCSSAEVLRPECWGLLYMDEYVSWWWTAFKDNCDGKAFAECFYIAMTPYAPADCSIFGGKCNAPDWDDFKGKWNDVRNAYVAVSQ